MAREVGTGSKPVADTKTAAAQAAEKTKSSSSGSSSSSSKSSSSSLSSGSSGSSGSKASSTAKEAANSLSWLNAFGAGSGGSSSGSSGGGKSPSTRNVQTVNVSGSRSPSPAGLQAALEAKVRRDYPLASDKLVDRIVANEGQVPFEGVVDWGGIGNAIYDFVQAPAKRRMEREAEAAAQNQPRFDKVDPDTKLSFGMLLDLLGTPELSTAYIPVAASIDAPVLTSGERSALARYVPERLPAEPLPKNQPPPAYNPVAGNGVDSAYVADRAPSGEYVPAAVAAIDNIVGLPRRDPRGYNVGYDEPVIRQSDQAGDLFETDGQVMTPDGRVVRQGAPAIRTVAATPKAAAAEPSVWDNVVDNTGKLLSHTGLGGIVSTLFPDFWAGMGDSMKGLATGSPPVPMSQVPNWDNDRGVWYGSDSSRESPQIGGLVGFIDVNGNGIDDRLEGYTPGGTLPPGAPRPSPTGRDVVFPDMPPFNPGIDAEWRYFRDTYADGGEVGEGYDRAAMQSDPRMALIAAAEDAIENFAEGDPQAGDEAALRAFVEQFGDAALKELAINVKDGMKANGGRLIEGPGGPKDDAVPAVVTDKAGRKRPAALSDGEFVFPVEAVEGAGGPEALQQLSDMLAARGQKESVQEVAQNTLVPHPWTNAGQLKLWDVMGPDGNPVGSLMKNNTPHSKWKLNAPGQDTMEFNTKLDALKYLGMA